jgi:hypothetical protein
MTAGMAPPRDRYVLLLARQPEGGAAGLVQAWAGPGRDGAWRLIEGGLLTRAALERVFAAIRETIARPA